MNLASDQQSRDADELREQFKRRRDDRSFEHSGGIVLYAMDNDVITSVTKPWDVEHRSYLRYFLSADKEAQESLAYIIAEYFLGSDPALPRPPFLLIHPTDVELDRLWNNVYAGALRQRNSIEEALGQIRSRLDARDNEQHSDDQPFIDFVRELLEILTKRRGEIAELQRIQRVQDSANIVRAHRITLGGLPVLPEATGEETERLGSIIKDWLIALDKARPPAYPTSRPIAELAQSKLNPGSRWTNNQIDAAVMGRVEWINQHFDATSQAKRLCFITGDVHIERIAQKRSSGKTSIAELYVRNPMCFLASRIFFRLAGVETPSFFSRVKNESGAIEVDLANDPDGEYGGTSLRDWLNVLFPEERAGLDGLPENPKIRLEIGVASTEWSRYLKIAAVSAGLREANEEFTQRLNVLMAERDLFDRLKHLGIEATKIGNDAVTQFGVAGVLAGFWSVGGADHWPNRSVPAVKFESFPVARSIIEELLNANSLAAAQKAVSRDSIKRLEAEESTKYTVFVVFSLAFAIAGEWKSAYTVARAAFSLASSQANAAANKGKTVKGDEAAYLCAVFCRLSAESPKDLDPCVQWLAAADERQKMVPLRASLAGLDLATYRDPRFKAEHLHRMLAERHFAHFMGSDQPMREQMVKRLSLRELALENWAVLGELDREDLEYVREAVTLQVAVNFLQLQFLAAWTDENDAIDPSKAAQAVRLVEKIGKARAEKNGGQGDWGLPPHVMFVYYCGSAMFVPEAAGWDVPSKIRTLLKRVKELRKNVKKRYVMPYDMIRADVMNMLIRRALKLVTDSRK